VPTVGAGKWITPGPDDHWEKRAAQSGYDIRISQGNGPDCRHAQDNADRFTRSPKVREEDVARQLRTAMIDYRFLLAELTAFRPSNHDQEARVAALTELLNGDLPSAWRCYHGLSWLQPPPRLRIGGVL